MKNLIIGIVIIVVGFFAYQFFFANNLSSQIANELHIKMPMIDKSILKNCAEQATTDLTEDEKQVIIDALNHKKVRTSGTEAMQSMQEKMQLSMTVLGEITECVNN